MIVRIAQYLTININGIMLVGDFNGCYIIQRQMRKKIIRKGQTLQPEHTDLYDRITKIEAEVLERIQELKRKAPKTYFCTHLAISPEPTSYNANINYYDLFWKQYLLNDVGVKYAQQMEKDAHDFERKLKKIDALLARRQNELRPFQTKKDRTKCLFECEDCGKLYKDEETLLLHIKIKHETENVSNEQHKQHSEDIFNSDYSRSDRQ